MTQVAAGTSALLSCDDMASVSVSTSTSLLGHMLTWEYVLRDRYEEAKIESYIHMNYTAIVFTYKAAI